MLRVDALTKAKGVDEDACLMFLNRCSAKARTDKGKGSSHTDGRRCFALHLCVITYVRTFKSFPVVAPREFAFMGKLLPHNADRGFLHLSQQ